MNIVVLGAGTVGTSIADLLCQHRHNVIVVDHDGEILPGSTSDLTCGPFTDRHLNQVCYFRQEWQVLIYVSLLPAMMRLT